MTEFESFLESSSINGLNHISNTRRHGRLFWILVVLTGFIFSGFLIYESFQSWKESPVKTTIETLPITELTFPKVTVCPPKNTFTDLNYDLLLTKNMSLDNDLRIELTDYALELLHDNLFDRTMANLSKLHVENRYQNWYNDIEDMKLPYYNNKFSVYTNAPSGSIITQYFGEQFSSQNVESEIECRINLDAPRNYIDNENITFHIVVKKNTMKDLSSGFDKFRFDGLLLDAELDTFTKNYTPLPTYLPMMSTQRKVSKVDIENLNMNMMPGFNITWYYSANFGQLDTPEVRQIQHSQENKLFIRKVSVGSF